MRPDILIQNVSSQCIPNLVAAQTFRPKKIVWVYTSEFGDVLRKLRESVQGFVPEQENWLVDARDVQSMHATLAAKFGSLSRQSSVIFHLTGGTKSMAIQGQLRLIVYFSGAGSDVRTVVMDPKTQCFDQLYPKPVNNAFACRGISLDEIIGVHGNVVHRPGRDLSQLLPMRDALARLRKLSPSVTRQLNGRKISARQYDGWYELLGGKGIPPDVRRGLEIAADMGVLRQLDFSEDRFRCEPMAQGDPVAYVRNVWIEDWAGAALASAFNDWQGGYSGVQVRIGKSSATGVDTQEFDFLGARLNRLVYWSCKNVKEVKSMHLFEVDALRDEVGGRDFHIAGLLYAGKLSEGLEKKARRLGVACVDALAPDAEVQLITASGG